MATIKIKNKIEEVDTNDISNIAYVSLLTNKAKTCNSQFLQFLIPSKNSPSLSCSLSNFLKKKV